MQIRTLKDLYIFGLQDMNDGCRQSFETMEALASGGVMCIDVK